MSAYMSRRMKQTKNIPILPILSGTFASKSDGPSLSGIKVLNRMEFIRGRKLFPQNVFPQNVLKKENQYKTKKAPPFGEGPNDKHLINCKQFTKAENVHVQTIKK